MKREFLINVGLVLVLNLLIKVFFIFGIDRTVQNMVGQEAYGTYFTFLNFAYLFQIVNDFGIQNFTNKHIAQYRQLLPKYLPNILVLKGFLGALFLILVLLGGWMMGYFQLSVSMLVAISLNQILVALIYYFRSNVSGLGYYRLDSVFSVLDKFLMILIIGAMLWAPFNWGTFRIEWFAWGQFFALAIAALLGFGFLIKKIGRIKVRLNIPFLVVIIKESAPFALLGLLMAIYSRIDSVLLTEMVSHKETGIYASAYRIYEAGMMLGLLISAFLLPMFARLFKEKKPIGSFVDMVLKLMWVLGVSIAVPLIMHRDIIMGALYVNGDAYSATILAVLMVSLLALVWSTVNGVLLIANNAINSLNRLYAVTVIINLGLNLVLIPAYHALGAAVAAAISQWFVTIVQLYMMNRLSLYRFSLRTVGRLIFFPLVTGLLIYGFTDSALPLIYVVPISFGLPPIVAFVLGLFSRKDLIFLSKNR